MVQLAITVVLFMVLGRLGIPWWNWFILSIPFILLLVFQLRWPCVLLILGLWSAGWSGLNRQKLPSHDLMLMTGIDQEKRLVQLEGRVSGIAGIRMQLQVAHWWSGHVKQQAWGRVVIRLPSRGDLDLLGRTIRIKGWLRGLQTRTSSSEPDWLSLAIDGDYRGWMALKSWDLLQIIPSRSFGLQRTRHAIQSWVTSRMLAPPIILHGEIPSLLSALLLGQRDQEWKKVSPPFQRLGVSHLLAISGMHLALVASMVMVFFRFARGPRIWHWILVLLTIIFYMIVVDARPPIIRAGIMSIAAVTGILIHRRLDGIGLLSLAAITILLLQPGQLARPGFQLSFLVVCALLTLGPFVHQRYTSKTASSDSLIIRFLRRSHQAFLVSVLAWLISTPLVLLHFGQFSIAAVPLTMILMFPVFALMFLGFARVLIFWIPPVSDVFAHGMNVIADFIMWLVNHVDSIGWFTIEGIDTSIPWTLSAMFWVVVWAILDRRRNLLHPFLMVLIVWIVFQQLSPSPGC
ncbi:MAG: ComEC family competence protein [Phycisphaerales bacterium]|nr:ComEC family competence protein [Phycisphaerales bacterium]